IGLVGLIPVIIVGWTAPFVAAGRFQINFPENRESELSSKSSEYQYAYRPTYIKEIKKQRRKYSLAGPSIIVLTVLYLLLVPDAEGGFIG
ncbi:MAG: hypothetical protein V3S48_07015, partial [Candidatus Neomarinimicrobiota bacterium]